MLIESVEQYLSLRRALRFQLRHQQAPLTAFARYATARGDTHVRACTAVDWAGRSKSADQRNRHLSMVIALARHLRAEDARHEIPPAVYPRARVRREPFIFSKPELQALVKAAAGLGPARSIAPASLSTAFGLMAATGLRVSEALSLGLEDFSGECLVVRASKFRKSRLVPLHPSTAAALGHYLQRRRRIAGATDRLLVSGRGYPLRYDKVGRAFRRLVHQLRLDRCTGRPKPHLHDLRHSFAVHSLECSGQSGLGVSHHAVALSTYLGHAHVSDTYWYLHATPTLMTRIADDLDTRLFGGAR